MASLSDTAVAVTTAAERVRMEGLKAAKTILSEVAGPSPTDFFAVALKLGHISAVRMLPPEDSKRLLKIHFFDICKVEERHWQEARDTFGHGYSSAMNRSDLWQRYVSAPVAANDNKPKSLQLPNKVKADLKPRFQVTWFDDVDKSPAKQWIVKGLIGAGEASLWVAKPGTAKSVLLCDIGCHIAAGRDWHGRKVNQSLVVFFAAERKSVTERRIAAWRKHHGVSGIPFAVVGGKLDMTSGLIDARALAATIKGCEEKSGLPCRLVILDTVTRTFGPGDQNSSKDMTRFIQSVDQLTQATGAHVAAIHHSGWGGDRGKGAVDLDGAVDVSYGVSVIGKGPTKVFKLECTGANDGDEGDITSFRLASVELGTDADGNVTDAPVLVQVDGSKHDGSNLKGNTGKALDSIKRAIEEHGDKPPDGSPGFPDGVVMVTRDQWRDQVYADVKIKEPAINDETLKKRFNRAVLDLTSAKQIEAVGEWFWVAGQN
jgi:hypothetical protein